MRDPKSCVRLSCLAVVALTAACVPPGDPVGPRFPDDRVPSPAAVAAPRIEGDESMAALTAEIRQLRVAVEELARRQTETQALNVYLSAQQGRVSLATQQLEAARKEADSATEHSRDAEAQLARFSEELSRSPDRAARAGLEDAIRNFEVEKAKADLELQQARARENDLSLGLAREEDRWGDLLSRLGQLTQ